MALTSPRAGGPAVYTAVSKDIYPGRAARPESSGQEGDPL